MHSCSNASTGTAKQPAPTNLPSEGKHGRGRRGEELSQLTLNAF
jgi:hypothetical protein